MIESDVIIVGGGPAGAACAWRLNQNNIKCLILDQFRFPRTKPCAGWITPQVVQDLNLNTSDYPYGLTSFNSFHISIRNFKFKYCVKQYAIRRIEFDEWLLHRAGVPNIFHNVKTIKQSKSKYIVDDRYSSKYLIGAGGTHCPVYRTFFREVSPRSKESLIVALEEEFPYAHADDRCQLWFMENHLPGYAWYVPKTDGVVNVGIGGNAEQLKANGETLRKHWSRLVEKLDSLGLVKGHSFKPMGYSYYLRQKHPQVRMGNALIVGDAVGLATLDMGEGIRSAIKSGLLAAEAIIRDTDYSVASIPKYSLFSLIGLAQPRL